MMLSHRKPSAAPARVGLTTTIPVEVVLAAGLTPVDLNNLFISDPEARQRVARAEAAGLPRTICAWVKGIYASLKEHPEIQAVLVATQGDCSYTQALGEILESEAREVIHFKFPYPRDRKRLKQEIEALMARLGTDWQAVARVQARLTPVRRLLRELDRLTWETGQVTGQENFQFLIASSDFDSDLEDYEARLAALVAEAAWRPSRRGVVRLGLAGIPPIFSDLWGYIEELGADVVFNEMPRQFSMPYDTADLVEQYWRYTYPYDIGGRLVDLAEAARVRKLDGIIHYTQSFCFRQMFDQTLREYLPVPILTIEGDSPTPLDARTRLRLEAFVDVLRP
jgi:benzoyl-CoA reductase/2-hydroxyglutaryl-CoA dehydratase subunit BcrC/BadD/HgdB